MVYLFNSHTNATKIGWHLWEIDLRFAHGLPPGWQRAHLPPQRVHPPPFDGERFSRSQVDRSQRLPSRPCSVRRRREPPHARATNADPPRHARPPARQRGAGQRRLSGQAAGSRGCGEKRGNRRGVPGDQRQHDPTRAETRHGSSKCNRLRRLARKRVTFPRFVTNPRGICGPCNRSNRFLPRHFFVAHNLNSGAKGTFAPCLLVPSLHRQLVWSQPWSTTARFTPQPAALPSFALTHAACLHL